MGKIVTTEYEDDFDGETIASDIVDEVEFSYRGEVLTLVLTKEHGAQFDADMKPYVEAARKAQARGARAARRAAAPTPRKSAVKQAVARKAVGKKAVAANPKKTAPDAPAPAKVPVKASTALRARKASARAAAPTASGPDQNRAIREWAEAKGITVSKRGRIAADVVAAFSAAH